MNAETIIKLVKASGVTAGEMILIPFWEDDKEIANRLMVAVASLGAAPFLLQQSRSINRHIFAYAKSTCFEEQYYFDQQPKENRIVCELGLGMNPNITNLCGYTVMDKKAAGTFHIAVGANTMFGGKTKHPDTWISLDEEELRR